ncbi:MAG: hypothetical protein AAGJ81_14680 [Verrucomicrobiota bacterium]
MNPIHHYSLPLLAAVAILWTPFLHAEEEEYEFEDEEDFQEEMIEFLDSEEGEEWKGFVRENFSQDTVDYIYDLLEEEPMEAAEAVEYLNEIGEEYFFALEENPDFARAFIRFQRHEVASYQLATKIDRSRGDSDQLRSELMDELDKAFEAKIELEKLELKQLEEEVKRLSELLDEKPNKKEAIIDRRFKDLVGDSDGLEW